MQKEDWHQDFCDTDCRTLYCPKHRLIYQGCQTAREYKEPDDWGYSIQIFGGDECPPCMKEYETKRFEKHMAELEKQRSRA